MESSPAFLYYNPEGTTQSRHQFVSQPPNSQKATDQHNAGGASPSMPFPSALVYQSRPSSSHMKAGAPQHIHAPTPIIATSVETLQKSSGLLTPSSPTLLGLDGPNGGEMYFFPPPPTPESMNNGMHTPINTPWGLDDNCNGTITPSEMQLSPSTPDVWKARSPMSPAYNLPMDHFMSGESSPTLMLSSCPSLSPTSSHSGDEIDFCDPRQLTTYPLSPHSSVSESFPGIADSDDVDHFLLHPITIKLEEDTGCKDLLSPFSASFDVSTPAGTINPADLLGSPTSPLKRSRDDSEEEDWDISSTFSDESVLEQTDLLLPLSPPPSDLSRSASVNPPSRKKSKASKQPMDADIELDEIIASARNSLNATGPAPITPATSFHDDSSCSSHTSPEPPTTPVVRRGRKQSLTVDPSKTFACNLCTRRFRRQEHLKRHFRSLHTREKPFSCPECGKKFSRSDNLSQHARTHGSATIHMTMCEDVMGSGGLVLVEDETRKMGAEQEGCCGSDE